MFQDILQRAFLQNRILDYLIFLSILVGGLLAIQIIRWTILRRLMTWAKKPTTPVDELLIHIVKKTVLPILYLAVFYFSVRSLTLGPKLTRVVDVLGVILLTIFGIRFLAALTRYSLEIYWLKKEEATARQRTVKAIMPIVHVIIWGIGITFLLDNLGVRISTVIAGLGIGGLAVALAAQAVLGDLFSYFSILLDHPFEIGDFIIVGEYLGVVEHIGVKTTRIRSLGGEQLVFSNTDLTNSRVRNYKRMEKRRVLFKIGVTYQTSFEHLKEIPTMIKHTIDSIEDTAFDRAHFSAYGDFSLTFEIVYYVLSSDYNKYMDIQQQINLAINEEFGKRGIEFAYPTQTLYVTKS
jgi:small-conductance mechanosensitive channel